MSSLLGTSGYNKPSEVFESISITISPPDASVPSSKVQNNTSLFFPSRLKTAGATVASTPLTDKKWVVRSQIHEYNAADEISHDEIHLWSNNLQGRNNLQRVDTCDPRKARNKIALVSSSRLITAGSAVISTSMTGNKLSKGLVEEDELSLLTNNVKNKIDKPQSVAYKIISELQGKLMTRRLQNLPNSSEPCNKTQNKTDFLSSSCLRAAGSTVTLTSLTEQQFSNGLVKARAQETVVSEDEGSSEGDALELMMREQIKSKEARIAQLEQARKKLIKVQDQGEPANSH